MFFIVVFLLMLKHSHTNMMQWALFSICNIQYFPVFITVGFTDYSERNTEWGVTLWTAIELMFLCFMHVFNVLLKFKNMFLIFFIST